jgi:hypothetical protein
MATLTGALVPAPEKGELVKLLPLLVKALTVFEPAELATQTLPEPSMAMLLGESRPLLE